MKAKRMNWGLWNNFTAVTEQKNTPTREREVKETWARYTFELLGSVFSVDFQPHTMFLLFCICALESHFMIHSDAFGQSLFVLSVSLRLCGWSETFQVLDMCFMDECQQTNKKKFYPKSMNTNSQQPEYGATFSLSHGIKLQLKNLFCISLISMLSCTPF